MTSTASALPPSEPINRVAASRMRARWLTRETAVWRASLRGLSTGALLGTIIAAMLSGYEQQLVPFPFSLLLFGFLGFALVSAGDGILTLVWKILGFALQRLKLEKAYRLLYAIPAAHLGRILAVALFLYGRRIFPNSIFSSLSLLPSTHLIVWPIAVGGAMVAVARMPGFARATRLALLGIAVLLNGLCLGWLLYRGSDSYLAQAAQMQNSVIDTLDLPNPGLPGLYSVKTLTYGSGTDRQRREFGPDADFTTPSVDGTPVYAGFGGLGGAIADWFWGFDYTQLPLNGRVWYPDGEGPFPLVLIVHGNHSMAHFSDPGYAYLAEHLASRGMIAVSVDENFLNGYMLADAGGAEMPLRGWLLLKHLQQWRTWNETPTHHFYGQVDLARVALIGHSRGGEAVTHAALLNTNLYRPVTKVAKAGEFDFGIRGVVGIAPSDGQYQPNGRPLTLQTTSYLMLVGGHDADTNTAQGIPTYNRVTFTRNPDGFAATAYLYRANHGQFNTVWGERDHGLMDSMLLNRRPYLSGEEQRQAAKVLITAFLEAVLNEQDGYRELFHAPQTAAAWLPNDVLVTAYKDASFQAIDTNKRAGQTTQVDSTGATATASGFTTWKRERLLLRDGETAQENLALHLTWDAGATPIYSLTLPPESAEFWSLTGEDALSFALAPVGDVSAVDVWIELESADATVARLPLSQFGVIQPPLPARFVKAEWVRPILGFDKSQVATPVEHVLQTYVIPLAAFQAQAPSIQLAQLTEIRFVFTGDAGGEIFLDEIGMKKAAELPE